MKKLSGLVVLVVALVVGNCLVAGDAATLLAKLKSAMDGSGAADAKVKAFVKAKLIPLCTNKVLVEGAKKQNAKKVSLDEIKAIDEKWKAAEEELPIHEEKLGNASAKEINAIIKKNPAIVEAFSMDNQGANVGQNALTSDYWQGDEAKWKNSYNGGKGGIDIGKVEFDKSANVQLQQVSLPLIDKDGSVVGAITYGIAVTKL